MRLLWRIPSHPRTQDSKPEQGPPQSCRRGCWGPRAPTLGQRTGQLACLWALGRVWRTRYRPHTGWDAGGRRTFRETPLGISFLFFFLNLSFLSLARIPRAAFPQLPEPRALSALRPCPEPFPAQQLQRAGGSEPAGAKRGRPGHVPPRACSCPPAPVRLLPRSPGPTPRAAFPESCSVIYGRNGGLLFR